MVEKKVGFSYGPIVDKTLEEQAKEQGYTLGKQADKFENCRQSLYTLRFGIDVPDGMFDKLCLRLHKRVIASMEPVS